MSSKKLFTAAFALALGLAWTAAPALAQQTTGEKIKDKAESAKDTIKEKATDVKDAVKEKASDVKDKIESKTHRDRDKAAEGAADKAADKGESKMDKAKDKASEVKDKVKEKTTELKDKAKAKTHRMEAKAAGKADRSEIMSMQQALKDKGYNPGPIDGKMGPKTHAALADFQKKEGLMPNGQWDDQTASRLGVRMSSASKVTTPASAGTEPSTGAVSASPATPATEDKQPPSKRQSP
jgi:hypothetical protein